MCDLEVFESYMRYMRSVNGADVLFVAYIECIFVCVSMMILPLLILSAETTGVIM